MIANKNLIFISLIAIQLYALSPDVRASGAGYWKGYYQYKTAVRDEKESPNEFDKNPIPLYMNLEQTDSILIGVYSKDFGAEQFKTSPVNSSQKVRGSVSDSQIQLMLYPDFTQAAYTQPIKIQGKLEGKQINGSFTITWDNVIYSGIVKLEKY